MSLRLTWCISRNSWTWRTEPMTWNLFIFVEVCKQTKRDCLWTPCSSCSSSCCCYCRCCSYFYFGLWHLLTQTDRQTERQTNRQTDGRTDRQTDRRTDGQTDIQCSYFTDTTLCCCYRRTLTLCQTCSDCFSVSTTSLGLTASFTNIFTVSWFLLSVCK